MKRPYAWPNELRIPLILNQSLILTNQGSQGPHHGLGMNMTNLQMVGLNLVTLSRHVLTMMYISMYYTYKEVIAIPVEEEPRKVKKTRKAHASKAKASKISNNDDDEDISADGETLITS